MFHNEERNLLIWVNEEDHLRFVSMQYGASLFKVFERLQRALELIETELEFEKSERLGYISCCPTNLGVAMRASVHVKLPMLC